MINRLEQYPRQTGSAGASLMTMLGIVSGEILTRLEQQGQVTVRQLARDLPWPTSLVMMAVGSLIREGLIQANQLELEIVVEPRREWIPPQKAESVSAPEVWGG